MLAPPAPQPSPQSLSPDIVEAYRTIMTPVSPDDWDRLKQRVDAAGNLARKAFVAGDRSAWEVAQVIQWRLQSRNHFLPTDASDALTLDAMYRVEESTQPARSLPEGLTAADFVAKLQDDVRATFKVPMSVIQPLAMGSYADEDWQWIAYQWMVHGLHFAKFVALSSIRQPHHIACSIYHNLEDETGRQHNSGVTSVDFSKNHLKLLEDFVAPFGVDARDEDQILYWTSPESLAVENFQTRMFFKRHPGWSLGSAYVFEKLLPPQIDFIRDGLRRKGLSEERLEWFHVHIDGDELHAAEWLKIIESSLRTHEDQQIVYAAAIERAERATLSWTAMERDLATWKQTGIPPHVPAKELREATGL